PVLPRPHRHSALPPLSVPQPLSRSVQPAAPQRGPASPPRSPRHNCRTLPEPAPLLPKHLPAGIVRTPGSAPRHLPQKHNCCPSLRSPAVPAEGSVDRSPSAFFQYSAPDIPCGTAQGIPLFSQWPLPVSSSPPAVLPTGTPAFPRKLR